MMFVHLLVLFFAEAEAIPTGRFDVVYPSMETFRSGIKKIRFRALDQDIELRLEPAGDVIADDFTVINGENGDVDHSVDIQSLKRKLYKDPKIGAALHIDEDGLLTINGIVNSKLLIQPDTSKTVNRNGIIAHRVTEVIEDEHLLHDYKILPPGLTRTFNYSEPLSDDKCLKIEYVIVADVEFTKKFKRSSVTMETYLANMMNKVEILLDTLDLGIEVAINGIIKLTEEKKAKLPSYIRYSSTGMYDAEEILDTISEVYCKATNKRIKNADIVMLITTYLLGSFEGNYFLNKYWGITHKNGACEPCYKYSVVRDNGDENRVANTIAHETAHSLGCDHDGEAVDILGSKDCPASDGYIMGNRTEKNGRKFSSCCKRSVEKMLTDVRPNHCIIEKCDDKQKRK